MAICREGWCYLLVVLFVIGGAVLRDINLLFILAGMMIGPLLFHWRLVMASLRRIDVQRKLPKRICAGDLLHVDIAAANNRRRLGSWAMAVEDSIQSQTAHPNRAADGQTRVEVLFPHVGAGQTGNTSYGVHLTRRGCYRFGPLKLSTRFPLGLLRASVNIPRIDSLLVCPRLGRLTRQWVRMTEADGTGSQRSQRRRGFLEGDYYGLREWRSGDSPRWIHWRTSARLGGLAVRQFEQQRSRDAALVLDLWQPESPREEDLGHVELAVSFAATVVADLGRRSGSHLVVAIAGQTRHCCAGAASMIFTQEVLEQLAMVEGGGGDHLPEAARDVMKHLRPGARPIVVSTRSPGIGAIQRSALFQDDPAQQQALARAIWLDVSSGQLAQFFRLA